MSIVGSATGWSNVDGITAGGVILLRSLIPDPGDDDDVTGGGPDAESASACIGLPSSQYGIARIWCSKLTDKLERISLLPADVSSEWLLAPLAWISPGFPMSLQELAFPITLRAMLLPGTINGPYSPGRCMKIRLYEFLSSSIDWV